MYDSDEAGGSLSSRRSVVEIILGDLTGLREIQKREHEKWGEDSVLDPALRRVEEGDLEAAAWKLRYDFDKLNNVTGIEQAILDSGLIDDASFAEYLRRRISRNR